MKRIVGILLALSLVLVGCTAQAETSVETVTRTVTIPPITVTQPAVTITLPAVTITPAPVTSTITMTPPAEVITVTPSPATITVTPPPVTITVTPAPELPPEPTPTPEPDFLIHDLAYIELFILPYSDDADPENEGFSIKVLYYDSSSEPITWNHIPVTLDLTFYNFVSYDNIFEKFYTYNSFVIHSSDEVRIPYENLMTSYRSLRIEAKLSPPRQNYFTAMSNAHIFY